MKIDSQLPSLSAAGIVPRLVPNRRAPSLSITATFDIIARLAPACNPNVSGESSYPSD